MMPIFSLVPPGDAVRPRRSGFFAVSMYFLATYVYAYSPDVRWASSKHIIEKSVRSSLPVIMSFSTTWGVEKNIWWLCHTTLRSSGESFPVTVMNFSFGIRRESMNDFSCWETSGFVGARIMIFESGCFERRRAVKPMAIGVFPVPVGRTTRVFFAEALAMIVSW